MAPVMFLRDSDYHVTLENGSVDRRHAKEGEVKELPADLAKILCEQKDPPCKPYKEPAKEPAKEPEKKGRK